MRATAQLSAKGNSGGGGRNKFEIFLTEKTPEHFANEAARQAILQLSAVSCPAGEMEVVLGPGWPGVLLHEAIGHGLEADFNRKKTSAFSGLLGKRVASDKCTVVDNGTLNERRGSLNVDDEGNTTNNTMLIENGILKGYMADKLSARLMGLPNTGNGRRESYEHIPMPRMTNTYMLAGDDLPEDIIKSVKRGLYAVNFGGGQVDITNGKFVFAASEAYLIEDGKITAPVKDATLIGNGPDVLTRVSMVGNDLKLDEGIGTCGKDGQSVPVGVGIPTLKIDRMTVGGTGERTVMATTVTPVKLELRELATGVVKRATELGASAAEAVASEGSEFSTVVRLGEVETLKESGSRALGVRVFVGQRAANTYDQRSVSRRRGAAGARRN